MEWRDSWGPVNIVLTMMIYQISPSKGHSKMPRSASLKCNKYTLAMFMAILVPDRGLSMVSITREWLGCLSWMLTITVPLEVLLFILPLKWSDLVLLIVLWLLVLRRCIPEVLNLSLVTESTLLRLWPKRTKNWVRLAKVLLLHNYLEMPEDITWKSMGPKKSTLQKLPGRITNTLLTILTANSGMSIP